MNEGIFQRGEASPLPQLNGTPKKLENSFTPDADSRGSADGACYQAHAGFIDIRVSTGKLSSGIPAIAIEDSSANPDNSVMFYLAQLAHITSSRSYFRGFIARNRTDIILGRVCDEDKGYFTTEQVYLLSGKEAIAKFFDFLMSDLDLTLVPAHQDFLKALLKEPVSICNPQ